MATSKETIAVCPRCGTDLTRAFDARPWCPQCEHGLAFFEPERHSDRVGWSWIDRQLYQFAYRRAADEFAASAGRAPSRAGWSGARVLSAAVAVLVHAWLLVCLGLGLWLCMRDFPSGPLVPGALLAAVAASLWPRAGRLPRYITVLDRGEAPALHDFVARVAAAIGAPEPHVICLDDTFGADAGVHGLLRRRHLVLGLRLWNALSAQERVALLGHQLAHFVDGDPRRALLTGSVDATLAKLSLLLTPGRDRTLRALEDPAILSATLGSGVRGVGNTASMVWISELIWRPLAAVLRGTLMALRLALSALPQRDTQRAEYFADALATRVGGSAAVVQYLDVLLLREPVLIALQKDARAGAPVSGWPKAAGRALIDGWERLPLRRQLSIRREVSLFAAHPPLGLRLRLIESRAATDSVVDPAVTLDDAELARIDAELENYARQVSRDLARA